MKLDFDDILLTPTAITRINSRSVVNTNTDIGYLPLFTAPMDTVICDESMSHFLENGIHTILPRSQKTNYSPTSDMTRWVSYGLQQFKEVFIDVKQPTDTKHYVLIDVANGHMPAVYEATTKAKEIYGKSLVIMVGNVANPETYTILSNAGADFVRIGIGNGGGCLTTQQTGIGYPMASLIIDVYEESLHLDNPAKIVADGGFKKYSDVIKALALGSDYVMLGSIFNKALESAGETIDDNGDSINQHSLAAKEYFNNGGDLFKQFRGMSTKEVQSKWGNTELKTSEGVSRLHKVEYTLSGWVDNFKHYLKSAMSYTDATNLTEFIGRVDYNQVSEASFKRFNK
jgi:GMP reductase